MSGSHKHSHYRFIFTLLVLSVIAGVAFPGLRAAAKRYSISAATKVRSIFHDNTRAAGHSQVARPDSGLKYFAESKSSAAPAFATIIVNSTADAPTVAALAGNGTCDLREALQASNTDTSVNECVLSGTPGVDTIQFALGAGTPTINVAAPLPLLNDAVNIFGDTGGSTRIELNGAMAGTGVNGLEVIGGNSTIRALVINRFDGHGILMSEVPGNTIINCRIGVNAAGTAAEPNTGDGIAMDAQGSNNIIGGTTAGSGNIISGNGGSGISIINGLNNTIQGNFIGTDVTGTVDLGNGSDGVQLDSTTGNTIGGTTAAARNIISGNGNNGVSISSADNNQVQGNFIGTQIDGSSALGNDSTGVRIGGSANNTIGGTTAGAGNVIAFNSSFGIFVPGGAGHAILSNSIFANGSLGINFSDDLVTPNDTGDADGGANNLQNFPVLVSVSGSVITASLNSLPDTAFRVEYFANATCDPLGNGEGEIFLGSQNVITDSAGDTGNFTFSFTPVPGRNVYTMTATNSQTNDTSEFSACLANTLPSIVTSTVARQQGSPGMAGPIATVNDAETPAGNLVVSVVSAPTGINVTSFVNNSGAISASVEATCAAAIGTNTVVLQVDDGSGGIATGNLIVTVTPNTPPTLGYNSPQAVSAGGSLTVSPATPPGDNGSFTIALLSAGAYNGGITVSPTSGQVMLTGASPVGAHIITIQSTDNCGLTTNAVFEVNVTPPTGGADLAITASGAPASAAPDTSVTYTLTVNNFGPANSINTIVNNMLPAAFTAEVINTSLGTCTGVGTNTINCNLGTLAVGAAVTISIQAHVPETCQPAMAVNTASVSGGLTDPNPGNNTVSVPTNVILANLGPGACVPATSSISTSKPGSVLFAGLFTSGATAGSPENNTRVNLTNIHPSLGVAVHLFFVDGATCSIADAFICLTPNQTTSFFMSDLDPGVQGYMMVLAVDGPPGFAGGNNTGCPISFNYLIGNANIKFTGSPRRDLDLESESVASEFGSPVPTCDPNLPFVELHFDGSPRGYNQLPGVLAVSSIPSRADGNDTILMIARVDGNWGTGIQPIGPVAGLLYNDSENVFSFSFNVGTCLLRSSLSNNFPRTAPRFEQVIPAGRSGWMKLWAANGNAAIVGAVHNRNDNSQISPSAFEGGRNLHVLRLLPSATITVPVFPPSC